ncbi:sensor histidine kinase [Tistrella bauzanensis]
MPIEGTLSGWPRAAERAADGTLDAELADGRRARIRVYRLAGGFRLLVGRDLAERARFRDLVVEASFWSLGLVLVLGLYGGWILARRSLARVDAMALAARRIVGGDLDERLPRAGSGDEYDRLAQAVNAMLDEIGRLMTASRVASDAMAHDLRGPLARARVTVEAVALRQPDPSEARAGLDEALAEIDRVIATFEALTAIGRAESGAGRTAWSDVDLSALVTELGEIYDLLFEDAGRVLAVHIAPGIARPGDRALMQRAVANLLENTLKHGAGPVVLSLARDAHDDAIVIRVADRGRACRRPSARGSWSASRGLIRRAVCREVVWALHLSMPSPGCMAGDWC